MTSTTPVDEIAEAMGAVLAEDVQDEPNYNVAPTQQILVTSEHKGERQLSRMKWGLVPFFAKTSSGGAKMINARAESVPDKPAYRRAFTKRRCLIPADGFYEWRVVEDSKNKQPWFMEASEGGFLAFAGLWEVWHDPEKPDDAPPLFSCTVVTTQANDDAGHIHDRMPVFLPPESWDTWLDTEGTDLQHARSLLAPPEVGLLKAFPVSTAVNNVRNNGPALVEPVNQA